MRTLIIATLVANIAVADQSKDIWPDLVTTDESQVASVASLVEGLTNRLHENPDDAGGWLLLAMSYRHLDKANEASLAYRRAKTLGKSDKGLEDWLGRETGDQDELRLVREWLGSADSDGAPHE